MAFQMEALKRALIQGPQNPAQRMAAVEAHVDQPEGLEGRQLAAGSHVREDSNICRAPRRGQTAKLGEVNMCCPGFDVVWSAQEEKQAPQAPE